MGTRFRFRVTLLSFRALERPPTTAPRFCRLGRHRRFRIKPSDVTRPAGARNAGRGQERACAHAEESAGHKRMRSSFRLAAASLVFRRFKSSRRDRRPCPVLALWAWCPFGCLPSSHPVVLHPTTSPTVEPCSSEGPRARAVSELQVPSGIRQFPSSSRRAEQ